jgi:tRNA-dihydrouridine synthase
MNTIPASFKNHTPEIHFAPLQGFTDMAYFSAYSHFFSDVDFYYTPYFSVDDNLSVELFLPKLLSNQLIAQVLPKDIAELGILLDFVVKNNFSEINMNLGCPYPMVTRKGRGAALIQQRNKVAEMIDFIHNHSSLDVSIKTRLGLSDENEILHLLDDVAVKKIKSVIVHPRTAAQLYKGDVSLPMYHRCLELFPDFDFIFNGDITSLAVFEKLQAFFPDQSKWMIGRGLLSDPFLAGRLKGADFGDIDSKNKLLKRFIIKLIDEIENNSKDKGHAINRIKTQFQYLSYAFTNPQKVSRTVKKMKLIDEIEEFVRCNL